MAEPIESSPHPELKLLLEVAKVWTLGLNTPQDWIAVNPQAFDSARLECSQPSPWWRRMVWFAAALVSWLIFLPKANADVLPAFAYHQVTLSVVQANGKPVAGASIYGFCRGLNLVWPRSINDSEWASADVWLQSYLGKTDQNGKINATIPPGAWSFFAAAQLEGSAPKALVVWSDYRETKPGETIQLAPTTLKTWSFTLPNGTSAAPKQLLFKPTGLPIWIPVSGAPSERWQVEMSAGSFEVWGTADAIGAKPGFALAWGALSDKTPDGKILPPGKTALLEFKGGDGRSQLSWSALHNFGLEGEVALAKNAQVLVSPGDFTLGYRRPVTNTLMGTFVGEYYALKESDDRVIDLDTPLLAAVDQDLPAPPIIGEETDDADPIDNKIKLYAQLYLVDGNGHLLSELDDASGQPARFSANVTVERKIISAENMPDKTGLRDGGQTLFAATFAAAPKAGQTVWNITGPPGVLAASQFAPVEPVVVNSATFKLSAPSILKAHALNMLAQAEMEAKIMADITNRKRSVTPTNLHITPGHHGSSASHNGTSIAIGTKLFYSDSLTLRHDFAHELGHNFGFTHGGLHETSNEVTRCNGADQISEQPAKWMFLDRMNGITHKEVSYHNTGLYLYCYAQGGEHFLSFISLNEYAVIKSLGKDYTADEVATAVLGLALGRDMTEICQAYGLKVSPERVTQAMNAAKPLCKSPKS